MSPHCDWFDDGFVAKQIAVIIILSNIRMMTLHDQTKFNIESNARHIVGWEEFGLNEFHYYIILIVNAQIQSKQIELRSLGMRRILWHRRLLPAAFLVFLSFFQIYLIPKVDGTWVGRSKRDEFIGKCLRHLFWPDSDLGGWKSPIWHRNGQGLYNGT